MRAAALIVVLGVLPLAACTGPSDAPAAPVDPPDGVRVSVYQPRPDIPKNRIAITVHNDGDATLRVTGASLTSSYFPGSLRWAGDAVVPAGYAVDLRVDLPAGATCDAIAPAHLVAFTWEAGERTGTSELVPDDPFELLDRLHDEACLVTRVDAVVRLTASTLIGPASYPAPADLVIEVGPTGQPGTVTVDAIRSTTLLNPAGPDGVGASELPLGIELGPDGPRELRVPLVPNRCDAHAIAEDKIGTRMPLTVTTDDGVTGRYVLDADDELRAAMYAFYSAYCGL